MSCSLWNVVYLNLIFLPTLLLARQSSTQYILYIVHTTVHTVNTVKYTPYCYPLLPYTPSHGQPPLIAMATTTFHSGGFPPIVPAVYAFLVAPLLLLFSGSRHHNNLFHHSLSIIPSLFSIRVNSYSRNYTIGILCTE